MTQAQPIREYTAAGGVVLDAAARVLVIERWVIRSGAPIFEVRLPKGHVEQGETDAQAALREVCEETGICKLTLLADLGDILTQFDLVREHILRREHYFLMRVGGDQIIGHPIDPGSDEARFAPRWCEGFDEAESLLTFESEREIMRRARDAHQMGSGEQS